MRQPATRDLEATIDALSVTIAELNFQEDRLAIRRAKTEQEAEHLADLRAGYERAAHYLGILLKYHAARRAVARGTTTDAESRVDARGTVGAVVEDLD